MNIRSSYSESSGYVNIHGQDIRVCVCDQTGSILVPIDELKRMGFQLYKKSQFNKLLVEDSAFTEEFDLFLLQSAQSYMLEHKIIFKDILQSINKCKQALRAPENVGFNKNRTVEKRVNGDFVVTSLREPSEELLERKSINDDKSDRSFDDESQSSVGGRGRRFNNQKLGRKLDNTLKGQNFEKKPQKECEDTNRESYERLPNIELEKPVYEIIVTYIEKPNYYWVQDVENFNNIIMICKQINEDLKNRRLCPFSKLVFNKIYLAEHDGEWHRCKIIKFRPLQVFFVDYGNSAEVDELLELSENISKIPGQAVRITTTASDIKEDTHYKVKINKRFDNGTYSVVLVNNTDSVQKNSESPTFFQKPKSLSILENGQRVLVIGYVKGQLVLRTKDSFDKLKQIERALNEVSLKPVEKVAKNQVVIIKRDKNERAIVTEICKNSVQVELLDEFKEVKVDLSQINHITEALAIEALTYVVSPKMQFYNETNENVLAELVKKNAKGNVILNNGVFDLQVGETLLSSKFGPARFTIDSIKQLWPPKGLDSYLLQVVEDKETLYFSKESDFLENLDVAVKTDMTSGQYEPVVKEVCYGEFQESWSRCVVLRQMTTRYEVQFIDFGNIVILNSNQLRALSEEAKSVPRLAFKCKCAGVPEGVKLEEQETYKINIKSIKEDVCHIEFPSF